MITTQCPRCQKRYQLADNAVGRMARCRCGASWSVAADGAAGAPSGSASQDAETADDGLRDLAWEDEIAGVFGESDGGAAANARPKSREAHIVGASADSSQRPAASNGSTETNGLADAAAPVAPPVRSGASFDAELVEARARRVHLRMPEELVRRRPLVAMLCRVYGVLMLPVIVATADWTGILGVCVGALQIAIAVGIVASGVMLRRGEEHAHAWAGLACVGLCFIPLWEHVMGMFGLATSGKFFTLIWTTALFAVLFAVPCYVTYWALRYEQARQALEEKSKL